MSGRIGDNVDRWRSESNRWTDERAHERTIKMSEWMNEWTNNWMNECINGWMNE